MRISWLDVAIRHYLQARSTVDRTTSQTCMHYLLKLRLVTEVSWQRRWLLADRRCGCCGGLQLASSSWLASSPNIVDSWAGAQWSYSSTANVQTRPSSYQFTLDLFFQKLLVFQQKSSTNNLNLRFGTLRFINYFCINLLICNQSFQDLTHINLLTLTIVYQQ